MRKQYLGYEYTFGFYIIETYHNGVLQKRQKISLLELDDYRDSLESEGYEPAVNRDEFEDAKKYYEWCLEHLLMEPEGAIDCDGRCLSCDYYDTNDCPDRQ